LAIPQKEKRKKENTAIIHTSHTSCYGEQEEHQLLALGVIIGKFDAMRQSWAPHALDADRTVAKIVLFARKQQNSQNLSRIILNTTITDVLQIQDARKPKSSSASWRPE
jgi:hypothetical protein